MSFDIVFQEKIAQIIFWDHKFANQVEEIIKTDFFDLDQISIFLEVFFKYKKKYERYPAQDAFGSILSLEIPDNMDKGILREKVLRFYKKILKNEEINDEDYFKEKFVSFCKNKALVETIKECIPKIEKEEYDSIESAISNVMKLGIDHNFGHDYFEDIDDRYDLINRDVISTGSKELDNVTKGGFAKKELAVFIGSTGSGKSFFLANFIGEAAKLGFNGIYYTLELSESRIGQRIDTKLTGVPLDDLVCQKTLVKQRLKKVLEQSKASIVIKEYPQYTATITTIKNHIRKLAAIKNFRPDIIAVDYGDLLKGRDDSYEATRHNLKRNFDMLRTLAVELNVAVVTATQTNRGGLNAELVTLEHIGESYGKAHNADLICTISRTLEDKNNNTGKVCVIKNRNGIDGVIFPANLDYGRVKIDILPRLTNLNGNGTNVDIAALKKKIGEV